MFHKAHGCVLLRVMGRRWLLEILHLLASLGVVLSAVVAYSHRIGHSRDVVLGYVGRSIFCRNAAARSTHSSGLAPFAQISRNSAGVSPNGRVFSGSLA